ncbi:probable ATP-dependent RNA helicase spindle-E [Hetaerina americana]|uniref:probable ATP-dependent RNA helicase spindle-E n=1 Tax=Hetaerina americana TaxID=62018 RepID=UPI003A7F5443
MMDLMDFFDLSKSLERVTIPAGISNTRRERPPPSPVELPEEDEQEYVREYQLKEEEELAKEPHLSEAQGGPQHEMREFGLMDVESLTAGTFCPDPNNVLLDDVFMKYTFDNNIPAKLPISSYKDKIISMIDTNPVTIIQGFTGCGKTTQVPQYILDSHAQKNIYCNIIVTQPRRIAAISIAERVARERGWGIGSIVGYQVGFEKVTSEDTRLTYCTTGMLLQNLVFRRDMKQYTHVILDEVHERDQDMDFVLLIVRKLLRTNSRTVKVILMSATFDVDRFSQYFCMPLASKLEPAPVITIEQERQYKVSVMYLDDLTELGQIPDVRLEDPMITDQAYQLASCLIKIFDLIEEKDFEAAKPSPDIKRALAFKGSVLIFLPGIFEIEAMHKILLQQQEISFTLRGKKIKWTLLPLHSSITAEEQGNVFKPAAPGSRKIILSTNIAESSITVPDIKFVIDFCLTKHLIVDSQTSFSSLQTTWAAKTNCIQRSGRVGRVCDGRVYRMVPKDFYMKYLRNENIPEILRCPLDRVVLQTKMLNMGPPKALLALSMDPPDLSHLKNTILKLKEVGALLMTSQGTVAPHDGDITYLGRVMAKLPVDVQISRLIVLGHIFNVLEECIIMGAAMSTKSVFSAPFQERLKAYYSKLTWANSSCSDSVAFLNAYKVWRNCQISGFFGQRAGDGEKGWAKRHFIQLKVMREVDILVTDLKERLKHLGIQVPVGEHHPVLEKEERPFIFKVVLAGAFYPNYFVRGAQGGQVNERDAVRQLMGRDPFTTVFLQGMPSNQPGELYVKSIRKALSCCADEIRISFEASSKVFVQFPKPQTYDKRPEDGEYVATIPGKVAMAVYKAIKLRQLKIPICINLLPVGEANKRAEKLGLTSTKTLLERMSENTVEKPFGINTQVPLPGIDETTMSIQISHIIDPGHFWAQNSDLTTCKLLSHLITLLNGSQAQDPDNHTLPPPQLLPLGGSPIIGMVYAAPFQDEDQKWYYRARVVSVYAGTIERPPMVQIFYVDYGNSALIETSQLRRYPPELLEEISNYECQAFECILSEIQPSLLKDSKGLWSPDASKFFASLVNGKQLFAMVYSVVHGVISLDLKDENGKSINQRLIDMGFAERSEESYLSKVNHDIRMQEHDLEPEQKVAYNQQQAHELIESATYLSKEPEEPSPNDCRTRENLRGPFSPLEMKIFHLVKAGMSKEAIIEWNSVNSVLLDTEPQDPHDRLLVSGTIGQNSEGSRLTLRHTTLMPNIHGLPALMALIFSPFAELRTNPEMTKLTGVLCGLGFDPVTNAAIFPDHDMEITFDAEILLEDIVNINNLRYWMNFALHTTLEEEQPDYGANVIHTYQEKVRSFLYKILAKRRRSQELHLNNNLLKWGLIDPENLIDPGTTPIDDRSPFCLHWGVNLKIRSDPDPAVKEQLEHLQELRRIATENGPFRELTCNLCNVLLLSTLELRLHLESARHKDLEEDLINEC